MMTKEEKCKLDQSVKNIQDACSCIVGMKIDDIRVLELLTTKYDNDGPDKWFEADGPAVINCGELRLSIEWSEFDDLQLSNVVSAHDGLANERVAPSQNFNFGPAIGRRIQRVWLGGHGTALGTPVWTALYFELEGDVWLAISAGLDENVYKILRGRPHDSPMIRCLEM